MLQAELDRVERQLRNLAHEAAYAFTIGGDLLFTATSNVATRVDFSDEQIEMMNGAVLTHNHPGGLSLSEQDVRLAMHAGLRQVRAVTHTHRYWINRPEAGWTPENRHRLAIAIAVERAVIRSELIRSVQQGRLTTEEANAQLHHLLWTKLSARGIVAYGWEAWTS